jgi:fructokinase
LFGLMGDTRSQLAALLKQFALRLVDLTRGAQGSLLFNGTRWAEHGGSSVVVEDTIGAGDTFTAATVLGLLAGWDLDRVNTLANEVAGFVCSQPGATPPLPRELARMFSPAERGAQ